MKILLLADPQSSHTIKWAYSLAKSGVNICIFGLTAPGKTIYTEHPHICVRSLDANQSIVHNRIGAPSKLIYLKALPQIKNIIHTFQPDIVHAHFASSYGLLGALSKFHPFILSVWGSDVFDFPHKSPLHKYLLRFNLKRADKILSTSQVMAVETQRYTNRPITVTPFGVDLNIFRPRFCKSIFDPNDIVIGTIKALEAKYGIADLIRAFKHLTIKYPGWPLKLLVVGEGSQSDMLKRLATDLGIHHLTTFTGHIDYSQVPLYHNMITIFTALSISDSESFGVAVVEASACGKPVVVSNVGGLPEVVEDGITGFIVPPADPVSAANAIEKLILDEQLRKQMGTAGRSRIQHLYNWSDNVSQMISIYQNTLSK